MDSIFYNARLPDKNSFQTIVIKNGVLQSITESESELEISNISTYNTYDLEGRIVLNGFTDGHMHLDKAMIAENVPNESGTLQEAIEIMGSYKKSMSQQDVYERANKVVAMAYANGTRYIRTHVDVDKLIKLKSLKALLKIKTQWKDYIDIQLVAFPQEGFTNDPENLKYLEAAIKSGADLIGGIPAMDFNPEKHIEEIFKLAKKYDVDIDMHIDETDDANSLTILHLIEYTKKYNYQGRVTVGHCCSLSSNDSVVVSPIIDALYVTDVNCIALPSTNLYLQGRGDLKNIRRGITPVKLMLENNVRVLIASDNIRDPFNPFGNADMLEEALIAAHGIQMGGQKELEKLFDMISEDARIALKFKSRLAKNLEPRFIILDSKSKVDSIISHSKLYGHFQNANFIKK